MGTLDILLGDNPVVDHHPVKPGVAILLGMSRDNYKLSHLGFYILSGKKCQESQIHLCLVGKLSGKPL